MGRIKSDGMNGHTSCRETQAGKSTFGGSTWSLGSVRIRFSEGSVGLEVRIRFATAIARLKLGLCFPLDRAEGSRGVAFDGFGRDFRSRAGDRQGGGSWQLQSARWF